MGLLTPWSKAGLTSHSEKVPFSPKTPLHKSNALRPLALPLRGLASLFQQFFLSVLYNSTNQISTDKQRWPGCQKVRPSSVGQPCRPLVKSIKIPHYLFLLLGTLPPALASSTSSAALSWFQGLATYSGFLMIIIQGEFQ